VIVRHDSELGGEALNGKIYFNMESGSNINEEEKCYGLAQSNALDGVLSRDLRWDWLFDTGVNIVILMR
jgi:hypothetical protein